LGISIAFLSFIDNIKSIRDWLENNVASLLPPHLHLGKNYKMTQLLYEQQQQKIGPGWECGSSGRAPSLKKRK
jgi:hypothetical protein